MEAEKLYFLKSRLLNVLKAIPPETPPVWGKMSLQQMTEHFSDSVRIASGKVLYRDIITPPGNLQKMRQFLVSDKPLRPNTINPLLPEMPPLVKNNSVELAIEELDKELHHFFSVFETNPHLITRNPLFGDLDFDMNVQLMYKHAVHHLSQFGVRPEELQGVVI